MWERQLFHKFIALCPTENICFISDDDLIGLESNNVIYSGEGLNYALFSTKDVNVSFNQCFVLTQQENSNTIYSMNAIDSKDYKPFEEMKVKKEYPYNFQTYLLAA